MKILILWLSSYAWYIFDISWYYWYFRYFDIFKNIMIFSIPAPHERLPWRFPCAYTWRSYLWLHFECVNVSMYMCLGVALSFISYVFFNPNSKKYQHISSNISNRVLERSDIACCLNSFTFDRILRTQFNRAILHVIERTKFCEKISKKFVNGRLYYFS